MIGKGDDETANDGWVAYWDALREVRVLKRERSEQAGTVLRLTSQKHTLEIALAKATKALYGLSKPCSLHCGQVPDDLGCIACYPKRLRLR